MKCLLTPFYSVSLAFSSQLIIWGFIIYLHTYVFFILFNVHSSELFIGLQVSNYRLGWIILTMKSGWSWIKLRVLNISVIRSNYTCMKLCKTWGLKWTQIFLLNSDPYLKVLMFFFLLSGAGGWYSTVLNVPTKKSAADCFETWFHQHSRGFLFSFSLLFKPSISKDYAKNK